MSNKLKELIDLYKSKKFVQAEKKCSDLLINFFRTKRIKS